MKYTEENLKGMKRADLQKLCKNIGIKANMKTGKLLEEIMKYCNEEKENSKKENFMCIEGCVDVATKSTDIPSNFQQDEEKKQKIMTARSKIPRRTKQSARNAEQVKAPTKTPLASVEKRKNKRPTTPRDWAKIHQQQFEKMDSLDVYLSKKQQRAKDLFHTGKKVNVVKPLVDVDVPAKPSEVGLWKKRLAFNISSTSNEKTVRTPSTRKGCNKLNQICDKPATPFRFTSNALPFASPTPRKKFDLQASLSKPLNYTPYTGKLPALSHGKQIPEVKSRKPVNHKQDMKAVKISTSRSVRLSRQRNAQSQARQSALSRRRGLNN